MRREKFCEMFLLNKSHNLSIDFRKRDGLPVFEQGGTPLSLFRQEQREHPSYMNSLSAWNW
jgi:hypothetical protein